MNILIDGQTFNTPEIHRGIGVYTKNVINNMLKLNYEHSWYICLSDTKNLDELDCNARNKLHIIKNCIFTPSIEYQKNYEYTEHIQTIIEEKNIDLFWIPNPLMVNVLFLIKPVSCRLLVTVYDIIPRVFPIDSWSSDIKREYQRRLDFLNAYENIEYAFISEATKKDFETYIGPVKNGNVAWLAADISNFYAPRTQERNNKNPYILFTGGFDYRKNIDGAIKAYARALERHNDDIIFSNYKLVIVGSYNDEVKAKYVALLREMNLSDQVILTGFVSDEKLGELYKNADLFFFPSKYEGFGLPILEAMLGGAYVVSADNSSMPEVCAGHALLCNANDIEDMASKLYDGFLASIKESLDDVHIRQNYALQFSWEKTGQDILNIIEREEDVLIEKKKLAILTPWPDMHTGIANYMYKIVPYLRKFFDIDIYVENNKNIKNYDDPINIYPISEYDASRYDHTLYELGNNEQYHKCIFDMFEKNPDIADIHDYMLTPFFFHSYYLKGEKKHYKEILNRAYGLKGDELYQYTISSGTHPNEQRYPMSEAVVREAKIAIFHNHWSKEQLVENNVVTIPLACFDKEKIENSEREHVFAGIKNKINYDGGIVIGCFGWVNENNRPYVVLEAVANLVKKGFKIRLCFWGTCSHELLKQKISELGIEKNVYISGFLSELEYAAALELTDVVVNLRYPSMGESSATLCEAMIYGKPIIVSDIKQYKEYPDEVCWKLPVGRKEVELLEAYLEYMIQNPNICKVMGENAANYAGQVLSPDKIALLYYKYISNAEKC